MRVYLAAAYSRRAEIRAVADELAGVGVECTSRWLLELDKEPWAKPSDVDKSYSEKFLRETALHDVEDVRRADILVRFTDALDRPTAPTYLVSGARMFEMGLAWALGIPIVVVGGHQNVFDRLPNIVHLKDVVELKRYLSLKEE